jgi:hypothetical protein
VTALARFVRIPVFAASTGYTEKAVQRKIESGVWRQGREYRIAPDGHVLVDMRGYEQWVDGRQPAE